MQQHLTGSSLFVHALMQRQVSNKLLLVVEGDDEETILTDHVDDSNVTLLMAGGKAAVLEAAVLILQESIRGALALIDRDLDDLTGLSSDYPSSVVATDGYDFVNDIVLTNPQLMVRALRSHGNKAMVRVEAETRMGILDVVYRLAGCLAALRLINQSRSLGLNLRGFPLDDVLRADFLPMTVEEVLARVNMRSKHTVEWDQIEADLPSALASINDDPRHLGGHDLMSAAAAVLKEGGLARTGPKHIAASLYTAVDCSTICSLSVHSAIERWAQTYSRSAFSCAAA